MTTLENSIDEAQDALDSISEDSGIPPLFRSIMAKRSGVPFAHTLKQGFKVNSSFLIEATADEYAESFTINLNHKTRDHQGRVHDDILFHFNPRFNLNCVVRNSRLGGNWGREEIRTFRRSPFKRGADFHLEIFITSQEIMVAVDGCHFCKFTHRKPVDTLNFLEIDGDIALHKVELCRLFPGKLIILFPIAYHFSKAPLTMAINRLTVNTVLSMMGRVGLLPYKFYINLQIGSHVHPHPVIPFHMSVRWRPSEGDVIVFNSWFSGRWNEEVTLPLTHDMFAPGQRFRILIAVLAKGYDVTVNERLLPTFKHHFDFAAVDTLYVQGDVKIRDIKLYKEADEKPKMSITSKPDIKVREKKRTIS